MQKRIITQSIRTICQLARSALRGRWREAAVFIAIYYVIVTMVPDILDLFFTSTQSISLGDGTLTSSVSYAGSVYGWLIYGPMAYSSTLYFLTFLRNQDAKYTMAFEGFSKFSKSFVLMMLMYIRVFLWSLLFVIPGIFATIRYSQAYYVMIDHPEYTPNQCIEASKFLMFGNKAKYAWLQVSFIGWYVIASLPGIVLDEIFGNITGMGGVIYMFITSIPIFFVNVYVHVAAATFYELAQDNLVILDEETF